MKTVFSVPSNTTQSILCKRLPRLVEDSNVNNFLRLSFAPLTYSSQKTLYYSTKRAPQRDKAPSFKPAEFYCKGKSLLYSCDLHIREFMAFAYGKVLFLCRFKQTNDQQNSSRSHEVTSKRIHDLSLWQSVICTPLQTNKQTNKQQNSSRSHDVTSAVSFSSNDHI